MHPDLFGMAPALRKNISRIRFEPNGQRSVRRMLKRQIPFPSVRRDAAGRTPAPTPCSPSNAASRINRRSRLPSVGGLPAPQPPDRESWNSPRPQRRLPSPPPSHCDVREGESARAINRKHRRAEIRTQPKPAGPAELSETIRKENGTRSGMRMKFTPDGIPSRAVRGPGNGFNPAGTARIASKVRAMNANALAETPCIPNNPIGSASAMQSAGGMAGRLNAH